MKRLTAIFFSFLLTWSASTVSLAAELTADALEGKWLFARMLLDGTMERKVNRHMEFAADGIVINYDAADREASRGTWEIVSGGKIIYSDTNGKQEWKVISFDGNSLHVDHRGAEMFFEKP